MDLRRVFKYVFRIRAIALFTIKCFLHCPFGKKNITSDIGEAIWWIYSCDYYSMKISKPLDISGNLELRKGLPLFLPEVPQPAGKPR